jgi:twitching motility protein PilT
MNKNYSLEFKVYPSESHGTLSIHDMLNYFLEKGTQRVTDLHIKVGMPPLYRIDGSLVKLKGPPITSEMAEKLIFPLLSDRCLERFPSAYNIDCSHRMGSIQFRINVFKENDGISAAVRALSLEITPIEKIGFPNDVWTDIVDKKQGLILVTGISGSGKSTTIASLIDRINEKHAHRIITLEDPIEYIYEQKRSAISQRELGRDIDSFANGLKAALREDPNVIVVGEMRDVETITMTLMAAETGHLVFSTLHTRDAAGTVNRILDYFPEGRQSDIVRSQLSLGLRYIISQRLIPRKDNRGRVVAMEILNNNQASANLIRTGKVEQIYSQLQTKTQNRPDERMITLERHLAKLVEDGKIEESEARRWSNSPKDFMIEQERD